MFGDAFMEPDDELNPGVTVYCIALQQSLLTNFQSRPKNCAADLELPDMEREGCFVGLRNQAATCYLNSLIQACYMSPEFRKTILEIPLCLDSIDQSSQLLDNPQKQKLLLAFQKLFAKMKYVDCRSVLTEELTKSFGWEGSEAMQQQDVQEANRIIFDVLDRALEGTPYQKRLTDLYKGIIWNHITCLECQNQNGREEIFYDLMIQVKGNQGIEESILQFITPEKLEGDNRYFCGVCNKKCDALKGSKLRSLGPILTLSLNRFEFDMQTYERKKINDRFEFALELDLSHFTEHEESDAHYELQTVIIHSGSAQGGHYHAYIRDVLGEGNWKVLMDRFQEQKQQSECEQAAKKAEIQRVILEERKKQDTVIEVEQEEVTIGTKKANKKKSKKDNKKSNIIMDKETTPKEQDIDYDYLEFPNAPNSQILNDWYDFNDSSVTVIPANRLQKQFSGSESAYILIYRKRGLVSCSTKINQEYLKTYINDINQVKNLERQIYEDAKQHIQIYVADSSVVNFCQRKVQDKYDYLKSAQEFRLNVNTTTEQTYALIAKRLGIQGNFKLLEVIESSSNRLTQFRRILNGDQRTLKESEVDHWSFWVLMQDAQMLQDMQDLIGEERVPIRLNVWQFTHMMLDSLLGCQTVLELKQQLERDLGIPQSQQYIRNLTQSKVLDDDSKRLAQLYIGDSTDLLVDSVQEVMEEEKPQQAEVFGANFISIVVERDDEHGVNKYFVDINQTLDSLLLEIYSKCNMDTTIKRRLRRLNGNTLFYKSEYEKQLTELAFQEGGIRLCFERGDIPETGKIAIRYRICSKFKIANPQELKEDRFLEFICDPQISIKKLKTQLCQVHTLEPEDHKLYRADWLEDPVEHFSKESLSILAAHIKTSDLVILKDSDSIVQAEFDRFQIYLTRSGVPDDSTYITDITFKREQTLGQLKTMLLSLDALNQSAEQDINKLRIREIKRDFFYGGVLKNSDKSLKRFQLTSTNLVCQFLDGPEDLDDSQILLVLKQRDSTTRRYNGHHEFVFQASKAPTIDELKQQIKDEVGLEGDLELSKFTSHEFLWIHLHRKEYYKRIIIHNRFEKFKLSKKKKVTKKYTKRDTRRNTTQQDIVEEEDDDAQNTQVENLKKMPFLLKEGDFIGYLQVRDTQQKQDDFQTSEDQDFRQTMIESRRKKGKEQVIPTNRRNEDQGFYVSVDF